MRSLFHERGQITVVCTASSGDTLRPARGLRLKKSLGQHFLHDDRVAQRIVAALDPRPGETIVEIGPGAGALTRHLRGKAGRLVAIEIDRRVVERLTPEVGDGGVEVIHADVLRTDLAGIAGSGRIKVVGNIPYNITSPILFHLLDHRAVVAEAVLMMQREVARRLAAGPGGREYGILSVVFGLYADVRVLFDVAPGAFVPAPAVRSAVVRCRFLARPRYPVRDHDIFRAVVRTAFGKRRKTLKNALHYYPVPMPAVSGIDPGTRPEQLSVEQFVRLANAYVGVAREDRP